MNAAEHPGGLLLRHFRHADGNEDPNVRNGPQVAAHLRVAAGLLCQSA